MQQLAKIMIVVPLALCLAGCGASLGAWHVGIGVLGAGAGLWSAKAQADNNKLQAQNLRLQAETARLQARATEATIRLTEIQARIHQEQYVQAVAAREAECGNYVHAANSFASRLCQGLERTAVCKYVYAATKRSPDVCLPTLRRVGYGV